MSNAAFPPTLGEGEIAARQGNWAKRKPFRGIIVPGGVYGGGARRPRAVRETGRSRRSPEGVEGRGAHGGRAQCAKQAVVSPMKQGVPQASLRAQWDDHAELRNSAKRFAAPEYRASEAQAGTKTPVRQGKPRVSLRTSEARRAEVASTRSEAQCAATQHRAAEGEHGAKTRIDYAALWNGVTAQP